MRSEVAEAKRLAAGQRAGEDQGVASSHVRNRSMPID